MAYLWARRSATGSVERLAIAWASQSVPSLATLQSVRKHAAKWLAR